MKKITALFLTAILLICGINTASAYDIGDDVKESFLAYNVLYLTEETKAGEIRYFGERITFKDKDGNVLSAEDNLKSGDTLVYFNTLDIYTVVLVGDCNCDGKITSADARIALRLSSHIDSPYKYEDAHSAWDTDYSQTISAADARLILRCSAKLGNFDSFKTAFNDRMDRLKENDKDASYTHDMVMVCMNPEYVNNDAAYTPEFYGDLVSRVEKWITYSDTHVWLKIYLKEPSKENLDTLYEQCKQNDAIIATDKNHIIYLEW